MTSCNLVIPNTFIVCGEGGNYCSEMCMQKARKRTPFAVGRRWRVERKPGDGSRCRMFDFVIVGPPQDMSTATAYERYKRCRIVCFCGESHATEECDYSHTHLKKYAKLVEDSES